MQKKWLVETLLPIGLIVLFSVLYFFPYYQGYRFKASDQIQQGYMTFQLEKLTKETGRPAFWAPNLFSGMPAYLVYYQPEGNFFTPFSWIGKLFRHYPPMILFIGALGFFIFLRVEGAVWSWALGGALAFVLTSYYTNMIVATHWGKSSVIFSVPYILAGLSLLRKGKIGWGVASSLVGWAGAVGGNHPQMLYYALVVIGAYIIAWAWEGIQQKEWKPFLGKLVLFSLTAGVGALSQVSSLLPFYEYGKYSIRGGSELERDAEKDPSLRTGLDKGYAQSYSASRAELWTILIPDFVGGTSQEDLWARFGQSSALAQALSQRGISDRSFLRAMPTYWGGSPFSAGSFYVSAIAVFLMILGWTYGMDVWDWLLAYVGWGVLQLSLGQYGYSLWATPILLLLPVASFYAARSQTQLWRRGIVAAGVFLGGWGLISLIDDAPESSYKLTDWALEYLPFYNKFRAPSTWLVVMGYLLSWMGIRGVLRFLAQPKRENLLISAALSMGLTLLIGIGGSIIGFSFEGSNDAALQAQAQLPDWFMEALREDRIAMARQSAFRSAFWIAAAGGVLLLFLLHKLTKVGTGLLVAALFTMDGWLLNSSYFPKRETYIRAREVSLPPPPQPHEEVIRADTGWYRVLPLHTNAFTDARPSVYFENVGGYHPAKLKRYQQFIEAHLNRMTPEALKMLAVRYITAQPGTPPPPGYDSLRQTSDGVVIFRAKDSLPIAWLVEKVRVFQRNDQTLDSIGAYPVHKVAFITEKDAKKLPFRPAEASLEGTERVICLKRSPYEIEYKVFARHPRLLVMSEIYYPPDWIAEVNGTTTPIIPANYILRAVVVPAGESIVRVRSESSIHERGRKLSSIGSVLAWILMGGGIAWEIWQRRRSTLT